MVIDKVIDIPYGEGYNVRMNDQSEVLLYTVNDGVVQLYKRPYDLGVWDAAEWEAQEITTFESDNLALQGSVMDDYAVFLFKHADFMSISIYPTNAEKFQYDDPYRLYWAYDTRKLYMNICNNWEMIGTLRHELLDGAGKLTHDEIDKAIQTLQETVNTLKAGGTIINGLSGNVDLVGGSNVSVSTNDKNQIVISSTGGGGGTSVADNSLIKLANYQTVDALPDNAADNTSYLLKTKIPKLVSRVNGQWFYRSLAEYTGTLVDATTEILPANPTEGSVYTYASKYPKLIVYTSGKWFYSLLHSLDSLAKEEYLPEDIGTWNYSADISTLSYITAPKTYKGYTDCLKIQGTTQPNNEFFFTKDILFEEDSTVTVYGRGSGEDRYDGLFGYIDGADTRSITGDNVYGTLSWNVTAGTHTIKVGFKSDNSNTEFENNALIYAITVTPKTTP